MKEAKMIEDDYIEVKETTEDKYVMKNELPDSEKMKKNERNSNSEFEELMRYIKCFGLHINK